MKYSEQIEKELLEKCAHIPFGNSLFQDESFILNTSYTDARAVRNCGLTLSARIRALKELEFSMEKMAVDIEEIDHKLTVEQNPFELKRLDIQKREKLGGLAYTEKLTADALYEIEYLRGIMAKLPKLSRSEFEAQEKQYFVESLTRQAVGMGEADKGLAAMGLKERPQIDMTPTTISERLGVSVDTLLPNVTIPKLA